MKGNLRETGEKEKMSKRRRRKESESSKFARKQWMQAEKLLSNIHTHTHRGREKERATVRSVCGSEVVSGVSSGLYFTRHIDCNSIITSGEEECCRLYQ